jgi:hypothetical protein
MPKISELEIGTTFRYPELGKTATLVGLGTSGARIKYQSDTRQVKIDTELAQAEFEAPGRPVLVSDYSDVEVISQPAGPVLE